MPDDAFPEYAWGDSGNRFRDLLLRLAATRPIAFIARRLVPLDRFVLHRSHGRFTVLGPIGLPVLVLTTTGRRSGLPRRQPLAYLRRDKRLIVAGTNFGQAHHPAWTSNLLANAHAEVTIGGHTVTATATQINGEEKHQLLQSFCRTRRQLRRLYPPQPTRHPRIRPRTGHAVNRTTTINADAIRHDKPGEAAIGVRNRFGVALPRITFREWLSAHSPRRGGHMLTGGWRAETRRLGHRRRAFSSTS